jgi:membrane-associated protein
MIEFFQSLLDVLLHVDVYLAHITLQYGAWTYAILFAIVFAETGLVVTPFLPGDSLLFAAGAVCALGTMNVWVLIGLLIVAAVIGDAVNYSVGNAFGHRVLQWKNSIIKPEHIQKTHNFYEKHGTKTIILARFVPIVRTFAPFVAGMGQMTYRTFFVNNVVGAIVWVTSFSILGYQFGQLPSIKKNFTWVVLAIIIISILPAVWEIVRSKRQTS